jgi:hypothetical protein
MNSMRSAKDMLRRQQEGSPSLYHYMIDMPMASIYKACRIGSGSEYLL